MIVITKTLQCLHYTQFNSSEHPLLNASTISFDDMASACIPICHRPNTQSAYSTQSAKGTIVSFIFNYCAFERSSPFDFQPIRLAGRWFTLSQSEGIDKHLLFQILIIIICFFFASPQTLYIFIHRRIAIPASHQAYIITNEWIKGERTAAIEWMNGRMRNYLN